MPAPGSGTSYSGGTVRHQLTLPPPPPSTTTPADALEALYHEHRALLLHIATHKFRLPREEAEEVLHDVFLSYMLVNHQIGSVRSWLIGAICHGCRNWLRRPHRVRELTATANDLILSRDDEQDTMRLLAIRDMLARLPRRHRRILYRHYYNGETAPEIAASTGKSVRSIEKRIVAALRNARRLLG